MNRLAVLAKSLQTTLNGILLTAPLTLINAAKRAVDSPGTFATLVGSPLLALTFFAAGRAIVRPGPAAELCLALFAYPI
nr:hypothetical protein [Aneurinibacillus sp. XH2]